MKVSVLQMTSTNKFDDNVAQFWQLVNRVPKDTNLISTPENTFFMRTSFKEKVEAISLDHPVLQKIAKYAVDHKVYFHLGSVALKKQMHIYNATVIVTPGGEIYSPYEKVHLFDIQLEGQDPTNESASFSHGHGPEQIEILGWKVGLSICYDLRFSELYANYQNVDLILVPSAFLVPTGKAHWEILLRARAIENQCFVLAAAQGGDHGGGRSTYGHSMIIDPWGTVIAEVQDAREPSFLISELDKGQIQKVRTQIPMENHRRL